MLARTLQIVLLCDRPRVTAGTIGDHVGAFERYSRHDVQVLQNLSAMYESFNGRLPTLPRGLDLENFDVFVIHYSNFLPSDRHFDAEARERIANFRGLKVLFLQDEYRQIDAITAEIRNFGIDVLFTCVPETEIEKVYPASKLPGLSRISNLTGYVPEDLPLRKVKPLAARPVDIGYRSRQVPFWLGELGAEKWQIAPKFLHATVGSGLRCDISYREEDRLYGKRWIRFIESCRSVLGTESGASVFDFTGELQQATERYLADRPGATFEDVRDRFLKPYEGRIRLNQISPRCFEAAALRTAMVLYEGEYSGVLEPERHYVSLCKDFSNIDDVVKALRNTPRLQKMTDRTYREIVLSGKYSYRSFIESFDAVVEREFLERDIRSRQRTAFKGSRSDSESEFSEIWRRQLHALLFLQMNIQILRFRIFHILFRMIYWVYARTFPASVRARLRPHVHRLLFRDTG